MKKNTLFFLLTALACTALRAQGISINTDGSSPDPSAILDVKSTDKGMLVPRLSSAQRAQIAAPAAGLLVFDTDTNGFWYHDGDGWTALRPGNRINDADQNTSVDVETNPNENAIRFTVDGTPAMIVDPAGNVGIGAPAPGEKLEVAGAIKIGNNTAPTPAPGTIRWNDTTRDFEGFTGTGWKSLTKGRGAWGALNSTEHEQLALTNGASNDQFGFSVSISGDYALTGTPNRDVGLSGNQGQAHLFVRSGNTWALQATLTAPDGAANDRFGYSVSISGDYAAVGALNHNTNGQVNQGKVYIFVRSGNTWNYQAMLVSSDGAANDNFGRHLAIAGDYVVVGAPYHNTAGNADRGKAYVFVRSGASWSEQSILTASDGAADDFFGWSVGISGAYIVVGATGHDTGGQASRGKAYVYARSGDNWTEQAILSASDGAASDFFGIAAAISGDYLVVGAWGHNTGGVSNQGKAYVFARSGATWSQQAMLTASDGAAEDAFGNSVAIHGDYILVSADLHNTGGNTNQGKAYIFARSGSDWHQQSVLIASDGLANDRLGISVALSGVHAILGAFGYDMGLATDQGKVYIFSN